MGSAAACPHRREPAASTRVFAISGVDFGPAWARRVTVERQEVTVPVVSRTDLIAAKGAAGRPRDRLESPLCRTPWEILCAVSLRSPSFRPAGAS